jgi:hypothetical protein
VFGFAIVLACLGHSCGRVTEETPRQSSGSGGAGHNGVDSGGVESGRVDSGGTNDGGGAGGRAGADNDATADSRDDARDAADADEDACRPVTCSPISCGGLNECGNCIDDDNDGMIDSLDPGCLGPCDNQEQGLYSFPVDYGDDCRFDCYFDDNAAVGDDMCMWDMHCDPLSPNPRCEFRSDAGTSECQELAANQRETCIQQCMPRVPNGCDCFGCCELRPGSGRFAWLGVSSCEVDVADDPTKCPPCTPVAACLNPCEHCELCLGKTSLPSDCAEPSCRPGLEPCGTCRPCRAGKYCSFGCCV